ncbi:MAG TPA: sigma-70 family RNA polymerase sigma factor [Acidimicrobiia bacterium]|nr:sigma-70 family RNA polymerase sigma factor [Acidimicrobiia bacterium]
MIHEPRHAGAATTPAQRRATRADLRTLDPADRDDERGLFTSYHRTHDRHLRDLLLERHRPLAEHCANRYTTNADHRDDLRQVALIGLLKAIERFDPTRNVRFATFAFPTITGEIKRYFRDRTWILTVDRRRKELHVQVRAAVDRLTLELGRTPQVGDVARELGRSEEDVLEALEIGGALRSTSLDAPVSDRTQRALTRDAERGLDEHDRRLAMHRLLHRLTDFERSVVYLRFYEDLTQEEIAAQLDTNQMQVSRTLRRALDRLAALAGPAQADLA